MALINHIINAFYAILKWPMSFKAHVMLSVSPYKFNQPVQTPSREYIFWNASIHKLHYLIVWFCTYYIVGVIHIRSLLLEAKAEQPI